MFSYSCSRQSEKGCRDGIQSPCLPLEKPHPKLSDYNLYKEPLDNLEPVSGVLPYDLNTELFSDYAQKQRFVYVPKDTFMIYQEEEVLDFLVGSMLVKNFYYDKDQRDPSSERIIIETRLLMHNETGWTAETYVWNEGQNEAFLQQAGELKDVEWIDQEGITRKVNFIIPTKNDCKKCHAHNSSLVPLGPKVRNLNKIYPYADGEINQLTKWEQHGILRERPDLQKIPKAPVWDDPSTGTLQQRARIYLDVNCGNCHNRSGSAGHSGHYLTYEEKDSSHLGMYKTPVAAGRGSGGLQYDIVPGHPDRSILVFRMESVDPAVRMPEIGRTLVHEEAVELIREWVQEMD
ncbi:hypothetical protein NC796_23850 [Aliifodinibius sp. S!AR15-10]|uniref:SO2930 family diheme c-type cytochrome n=1 Tax=Aliifodinibius sp. S!AR15-10 TaxID=2950437 RepID=UPI002855189F|nr:SO2930 family diheme c-type cytochrome [Aliifodinibius sp. S!AR15-10]MDR8394203.1 hypothetical protein [Aliifodinibius sp. S!AR15-10]